MQKKWLHTKERWKLKSFLVYFLLKFSISKQYLFQNLKNKNQIK